MNQFKENPYSRQCVRKKVSVANWLLIVEVHNLVSREIVDKLGLKKVKHPTPYKVSWLQKGHQLLV